MRQCPPESTGPRLLRAGDRGWLVELPPGQSAALAASVREQPWAGQVAEVVPASRTVLVTAMYPNGINALGTALARMLRDSAQHPTPTWQPRIIRIPVRYDGPDLEDVAEAVGLRPDEVAERHCSVRHVVGFFGFAPGFAYIDGLPEVLALPRRSSPRTRIEAGYVAIAGNQSVVYPGGTPGGWHLIGRSEQQMWDPEGDPPNRLEVGDHVVFQAVSPC